MQSRTFGLGETIDDGFVFLRDAVVDFAKAVHRLAMRIIDSLLPVNPVTQHREFRIIPTSVENFLGSVGYDSICPQYRVSDNVRWNTLVNCIGRDLVEVCDRKELDFEFRVKDDDKTVNAFCLPGGKIVVTTALLRKLEEDSVGDSELDSLAFEHKLAAVLGHEITHACAAHGAKALQLGALIAITGMVARFGLERFILSKADRRRGRDERTVATARLATGVFDLFFKLAGTLLAKKHSRSHEFQSDRVGMKYMHLAGYDARGGIFVQELFVQLFGKRKDGYAGAALELFATHPPSEERVAECYETWEQIQNGEIALVR